MTDDRPSISSSRLSPADVVRHSFGIVRRGFDPAEVRSFLELVARELNGVEAREAELRRQIIEAEERAKHPVLDEATLSAALGQSSAQVLRNAHEEAARIVARAEQSAAQMLRLAQEQATELEVATETSIGHRIAEVELQATALEHESRSRAEAMLQAARGDGETLVAHAREQGRTMVEQAQEQRRRVLADMDQRRRRMLVQIEQLRAARDELGAAVIGVRDSVDRITAELARSDEDAKLAAAEVARRHPMQAEPATTEPTPEAAEPLLAEDKSVDELFAKIRAAADEPVTEASAPPLTGDAALLAARDAAIEPSVSALSRKLKRTLQDDQNRVLEALRGEGASGILGDEQAQQELYLNAAEPILADAAAAGVRFADPDSSAMVSKEILEGQAEQLAATVVSLLRRHLGESGAELSPEAVGAAFKEWRGQRVERLVGDAVLSSFNTGVLAGVHGGGVSAVRWIVGGDGPACVDCADNALAGPLQPGEEFPTGHRYPPVHPGCRCLVAPTS